MIPLPFPEFEATLEAQIGMAVLRLLRSDMALSQHFRRIEAIESEEIFLSAADAPELGVSIVSTDEQPETNDQTVITTVTVELVMLHQVPETRGNSGWLRQRIVSHIGRLLAQNYGQLQDEHGRVLTEGLTRFARVPFDYRFITAVQVTPVQIQFQSWKNLRTGQLA